MQGNTNGLGLQHLDTQVGQAVRPVNVGKLYTEQSVVQTSCDDIVGWLKDIELAFHRMQLKAPMYYENHEALKQVVVAWKDFKQAAWGSVASMAEGDGLT